jgi:hypothetical protein
LIVTDCHEYGSALGMVFGMGRSAVIGR